jgi:hypothetical protein
MEKLHVTHITETGMRLVRAWFCSDSIHNSQDCFFFIHLLLVCSTCARNHLTVAGDEMAIRKLAPAFEVADNSHHRVMVTEWGIRPCDRIKRIY